jgi:hypothetical protein
VDIAEDASTESQIVVEPEVADQMVAHPIVPENSIAQVRFILSLFINQYSIMLLGYLIDLSRLRTRYDAS